jgi:hypothetical protein
MIGSLAHPITSLFCAAVTTGILLRKLFWWRAAWLWDFARPFRMGDITPWARGAMNERDGAEPYALLALVLLQLALTGVAATGLYRLAPRVRAGVNAALLALAAWFAWSLPPYPPMREVATSGRVVLAVVALSLILAALIGRSIRRHASTPPVVAALLFPVCFVSTTLPSLLDVSCIVAPALRLRGGIAPSAVYLQYDLLPSLLAIGWKKLGRAALDFDLVAGASYYVLLLGLFALARRLFTRAQLAAWLLVALVVVRIYGVALDANATPEATPMRLDLWPILIAVTLARGLTDWTVGLSVGALLLFSRSMGTLYLGAYVLALGADFLAVRRAQPRAQRLSLARDARRTARRLLASGAAIGGAMVAIVAVFHELSPEAVRLYRQLGVGMLKIGTSSFYWWLLPLTGAAGWLAFTRRASLPERRGQANLFAVALIVASSIYFFGRSHEHNLLNLAVPFLFGAFLTLDLAWQDDAQPRALAWAFRIAPLLLVAACAYNYSGRVRTRIGAQFETLARTRSQPPFPGDTLPPINCPEILALAGDRRIFFYSKYDFWHYDACGLLPQGRIQPLYLVIQIKDLVAQVNGLLDDGYKMIVPRQPNDWGSTNLPGILPALGQVSSAESAHYRLYRRP